MFFKKGESQLHALETHKHRTMLKLLFVAFLAIAAQASDVLDFTDDDFDSRIGNHDMILVEFFAPW